MKFLIAFLLLVLLVPCTAQEPLSMKPSEDFIWQKTFAARTMGGDFKWTPVPFDYNPGPSIRYIDFRDGNDTNDGKTKETAWKHHPWDEKAQADAAACSGIQTYVFKRGIIYRGSLTAKESGRPGGPIQLTSDPSWGTGEAVIAGSAAITGGWKKGGSPKDMPEPEKVWVADVKGMKEITSLFIGGNKPVRVALARDPNWTDRNKDDVMAEWGVWNDSKPVKEKWQRFPKPQIGPDRFWMSDPELLTEKDANAYDGARVWTEYAGLMGSPYPNPVLGFDPASHAVKIGSCWGGAARPIEGCRYFIEDHPRFLDEPGEYWHDEKAGKLYIRLPGDADPNTVLIEVPQQQTQITIRDKNYIQISGLTFSYQRVTQVHQRFWDLPEEDPAGVKILGSAEHIRINNNIFRNIVRAVWVDGLSDASRIDWISITDNEMAYCDHDAIMINQGKTKNTPQTGFLGRVEILRNRIYESGLRVRRAAHGHTVKVNYADVLVIAGNIISRTRGAGIFVFGGKAGGKTVPDELTRMLIFQNQVEYSNMTSNDWGGIEAWQGGPCYIFDNVSKSPGGYWACLDSVTNDTWTEWNRMMDRKYSWGKDFFVSQIRSVAGCWSRSRRNAKSAGFAYTYYFDGAFKQYLFNNIGVGKSSDVTSSLCSTGAVHCVGGSFALNIFNNTFWRFGAGLHRGGKYSSPDLFLGNLFSDMGDMFIVHQSPLYKPKKKRVFDADADPERNAEQTKSPTLLQGWASNVFEGKPYRFGCVDETGRMSETLEDFNKTLEAEKAISRNAGKMADSQQIREPENGDYRPVKGSAAEQAPVRNFIPWALGATVGEWEFRLMENEPGRIPGEHWYMTEEYTHRGMYRQLPRHDLTAVGVSADNYTDAPCDNWIKSGLRLDGETQYCVFTDKDMKSDIDYKDKKNPKNSFHVDGSKRLTVDMDTNDFLIETVIRLEEGFKAGGLAGKEGTAGYLLAVNEKGQAEMSLTANSNKLITVTASPKLGDGAWHHVIAEVDRSSGISFYVDGKKADVSVNGPMPDKNISLSNSGDFLVGKDSKGNHLAVSIDFMRVCRSTLKSSRTSIEELYAWEFNGPQFRSWWGTPVGE